MTRRWSAGLVFGLAVFAMPALAQPTPPAAEAPAAPPVIAEPKVLDATGRTAAPDTAAPDFVAATPAANPKARFQFVRVGDTILKLNGDSGAVSFCDARGTGWACQALPENRVALEYDIGQLRQKADKEIADLKSVLAAQNARSQAAIESLNAMLSAQQARSQREIEDLKDELKAVKLAVAPPPPPPAPPERTAFELRMPNAQDYERARAVVEDAWRRLAATAAQIQSDVLRKF